MRQQVLCQTKFSIEPFNSSCIFKRKLHKQFTKRYQLCMVRFMHHMRLKKRVDNNKHTVGTCYKCYVIVSKKKKKISLMSKSVFLLADYAPAYQEQSFFSANIAYETASCLVYSRFGNFRFLVSKMGKHLQGTNFFNDEVVITAVELV